MTTLSAPSAIDPSRRAPGDAALIEPRPAAGQPLPPREPLVLGGPGDLTPEAIDAFAHDPQARAQVHPAAWLAMDRSRDALHAACARGEPIYGLTTGFGPFVSFAASPDAGAQGAGLIAHLGAGVGPPSPEPVAIATMLVRLRALTLGMSGVTRDAAHQLLALLNARVCPIIPSIGSVGASGDLVPLSFIARAMMGQGQVTHHGERLDAAHALARIGRTPLALTGRDALAIVNGTAFMTAHAAIALARAQRLLDRAESITGWIYRLLGARAQALDPRLHAARGHPGQVRSADAILREAASLGPWEDHTRPLQEVYSIRCAPQVLGAARDQIDHARLTILREINGVNDNPVVWSAGDHPAAVLHGGNFQGQQIAFAADQLNAAIVQAAVLAERQLDVLLNPEFNGGAPLLLAWTPGACSGLAGAQLTATAHVAEMRHHGGPVATSSIPTNGRNQDVVSMGALAARAALDQTDRLAAVLAVLALAADRLADLRRRGRAPGRPTPTPAWVGSIEPFDADRPLHADIDRLARRMLHAGA